MSPDTGSAEIAHLCDLCIYALGTAVTALVAGFVAIFKTNRNGPRPPA